MTPMELDRVPPASDQQQHDGSLEVYYDGRAGSWTNLGLNLGTGQHYFHVPVTEIGLAICERFQTTDLYLTDVSVELNVIHEADMDLFAACVKIPVAEVPNIAIDRQGGTFQLGTPHQRPLTVEDQTMRGIIEHAYSGRARDGTLFNAPMSPGDSLQLTASVNGWPQNADRGRFSTVLSRRGGWVNDTVHVTWEMNKRLRVCDYHGNLVGDWYRILCGVRAQVDNPFVNTPAGSRGPAYVEHVRVAFRVGH